MNLGLNGHTRIDPPTMPPHNRDAERSLLGSMLRDNSVIAEIVAAVRPESFYVFGHQAVFTAIERLDGEGLGADPVTVTQELIERDLIADAGGGAYVAELYADAPSSANVERYVTIILDQANKRDALHFARDLQAKAMDPTVTRAELIEQTAETIERLGRRVAAQRFTIGELLDQYPNLNAPVVDGVFRERETVNIISYSKIGKSWLAYSLALSIATGRCWLHQYPTAQGRVLIFDNELHKPTIGNRIKTVADALEIPWAECQSAIEVVPLRGNLLDIHAVRGEMRRAKGFKAIIIDAKYRMMPSGSSENDNADETRFYNALDQYAEMTGAAIINIHHASKGDQSSKRVTDVGAGGGAQSRAADCHLVLREHEDYGVVVLEAAVRSFAPVEPLALRWTFPLWQPAENVDPSNLRGLLNAQDKKQRQRDSEGIGKIIDRLMEGPATARQLRVTGVSKDRIERLLGVLASERRIEGVVIKIRGNDTVEYRLVN